MRMLFPDEMFFLKNKGNAEFAFEADMFPHNQTQMKRTKVTLKGGGDVATISGLTLRLKSAAHGAELVLVTDVQGKLTLPRPVTRCRHYRMNRCSTSGR
jgi:hypothetical protein